MASPCDQGQQSTRDGCMPGTLQPETLSSAIAHRIAQEAFNRGSMDNIAVIVVDLATDENIINHLSSGDDLKVRNFKSTF